MIASPDVAQRLLTCCGSEAWAQRMAAGWPYPTFDSMLDASDRAFDALSRDDWMQAFAAHARIGAPRTDDARGSAEQSGITSAAPSEVEELAELNAEYDSRFGHVFLICATGLSAAEMLAALRRRIGNDSRMEFQIAMAEQRKITALRLRAGLAP